VQLDPPSRYDGYIKCKLVHADNLSIVLPDQLYVDIDGELSWVQPLYFTANMISRNGGADNCFFYVDISQCHRVRVEFSSTDLEQRYDDGSCLYKCKLGGPRFIERHTAGPASLENGQISILLYHHTDSEAKKNIIEGRKYRSSNWNIQGTKKSKNIAYLYLTPLPQVTCPEDLEKIAMSSEGELAFRLDQNQTEHPDLVLRVYRESTSNRSETLSHWVDASLLATQPIYKHWQSGEAVYYEVVCPSIHRIGVQVESGVKIEGKRLVPYSPKRLDYAVVGDGRTLTGLEAPYDEEETEEILKVEIFDADQEIIGFWLSNGNSDQFSGKAVEVASFDT
jgi:hypothetical protein